MQSPQPSPDLKDDHKCYDDHGNEYVPNKKARFYVLGLVASLLVILFSIGILSRLSTWHEIKVLSLEDNLPTVDALIVKPEKNPVELILPSTTNAIRYTPIWARVDGYLENFFVDIGDQVNEGQLLATIDTPEIDKQLAQARADLLNGKAQLEIAKISSDRWSTLYARNSEAVPKQEVDERKATLESTQASVKAYQANVERLEKLQGFKHILAPFSGIITERNIDIGSLITAGSAGTNPQQLFFLAKTDIIRVFVNVPQYFYRQIHIGMSADIYIQEFPNKTFKGYVTRTAAALDPVARTMLTEVHIDNKEGILTTGLYANVTFSLIPTQQYFIVPTNSLIIINDGPKIAILNPQDVVKIIPITLGRDYGKTIEVTSGLKEDDKVIINPDDKIHEGMRVKIRKLLHVSSEDTH